jgi:flagellar biosynthesis chaperone FliJ
MVAVRRARDLEARAREDAQSAHQELKKLERLVESIVATSSGEEQRRERRELDELAARVSSASRISSAPRTS